MITDTSIKRQLNWNAWAVPVLFILLLIIEDQAFGTYFTSWLYGLVLIFFGIIYSARYRLYQPAVVGCLAGITLWHYTLAAHFDTCIAMLHSLGIDISANPVSSPFPMMIWLINLIIFLLLLAITGPTVLKSFQLEHSAIRIFRAAAIEVTNTGNGFTSRPYSVGNAEFRKEQITGFTRYLASKMIVYPIYKESGIFLTFSMKKSPLAANDPSEISYIAFENAGKISVYIAAKDYKRFSKHLTFDRLCESLGDMFKSFLGYYANEQEDRIVLELKST